MASPLQVSFIIRAIDRSTAVMRKVTNNFAAMRNAKASADKAFAQAANIRQAAAGVDMFASKARAAVAAPVSAFADFEAAMSGVKAVTGKITDNEFTKLTEEAKRLGATTRFTAVQAAEGFKFFGIAGWNAAEQMKALPAAMNLSVGSGTELGRTADILSDIMGAYRKEASEAATVSDTLAYTISNSNTTLETLFETMKMAAPDARRLGIRMGDLAAMTGLMGSAGIKGTNAGTALRSAMVRLSAPSSLASKYLKHLGISTVDANQNLRPMIDILADVADKSKDMGTAVQSKLLKELFGLRALSGMNVLLAEGADSIRKFGNEATGASNYAAKMATTMDDNLRGKTVLLTSAIDGLLTAIGEQLAPIITSATLKITTVVQRMTEWTRAHPTLTRVIGIAAAGIAAFTTALTGAMFTMVAFVTTMGIAQYGIGGFKTGLAVLRGAMSATMLRMEALTATTKVLSFETMPAKKGILGMAKSISRMAIPAMRAWISSMWASVPATTAATWPVLAIIAGIAATVGAVYFAIKYWDRLVLVFERFKNASLKTKIVLGALLAPFQILLAPIEAIIIAIKLLSPLWKGFSSDVSWLITKIKELVGWLDKLELPNWVREFGAAHMEFFKGVGAETMAGVKEIAGETAWIAGARAAPSLGTSDYLAKSEQYSNLNVNLKVDAEGRPTATVERQSGVDVDIESWYNGQAMAAP